MTPLDKIKGQVVYISYPMTGIENFNREYGTIMEETLIKAGARVVLNPSILPDGLKRYDDYLHIDFAMIDVSDCLIVGEGWVDSNGCNKEYHHACDKDIDVIRYIDILSAIENLKEYEK